jgi:hypothetical protein
MYHGQLDVRRKTGIPQQFKRRCGIQDRGVKVVCIGKGKGDSNAIAFRELVCGWQQVKHQLKRLARGNLLNLAFKVIVPGQIKILERGLAWCPGFVGGEGSRAPSLIETFPVISLGQK